MNLSKEDLEDIRELFGKELQGIEPTEFDRMHKELRQKYHPDKFEQYGDEVVREMANDKFQRIEKLAQKVKAHFDGSVAPTPNAYGNSSSLDNEDAIFGFDDMKIEIVTRDKDLKYKLFGTYLRWLERGDNFKIPETEAKITIDQDHRGNRVGFTETVRIYLSFGATDSIPAIIDWLYRRLSGQAEGLIIEGKRIPIDRLAMAAYIRQKSFLGLKAPK